MAKQLLKVSTNQDDGDDRRHLCMYQQSALRKTCED